VPSAVISGQFTAPGSSAILDISNYQGQHFSLVADGSDGGGTLTVQLAIGDPPTGWVNIRSRQNELLFLTTIGTVHFLAIGKYMRVTLTGGTTPTLDYAVFH
jgi:hypothetical protein